MNNLKLNKGLLLLGLLITLTSLLLSVLLSWVDDNIFLKLEASIGYKWMMLILLIVISFLLFSLVYLKIFGVVHSKQVPEKICPSCGKPKLKLITSTVRSLTYKCSACGFDHNELKEGQTNF